jgi:hypothetical protein
MRRYGPEARADTQAHEGAETGLAAQAPRRLFVAIGAARATTPASPGTGSRNCGGEPPSKGPMTTAGKGGRDKGPVNSSMGRCRGASCTRRQIFAVGHRQAGATEGPDSALGIASCRCVRAQRRPQASKYLIRGRGNNNVAEVMKGMRARAWNTTNVTDVSTMKRKRRAGIGRHTTCHRMVASAS